MRMTFEAELFLCENCLKLAKHLKAIRPRHDWQCGPPRNAKCSNDTCKATATWIGQVALELPGYQQMLAACVKSEKKAAAVRENGKLGGRPKGRKNNPKPSA